MLSDYEAENLKISYDELLKRFRHLLESEFISSFDEVDADGNYRRDISNADLIANKLRLIDVIAHPFCDGCRDVAPIVVKNGFYVYAKCKDYDHCGHISKWLKEND